MAETVFIPSLEGMEHVKAENRVILTKPFLDVCKQILPVLGNSSASLSAAYKLGVLMVVNSSVFLYACLGWNMQGTLVLILVLLFS